MYFGLSEEQEFFQDNVKKFLADNASIEEVRKILFQKEGWACQESQK